MGKWRGISAGLVALVVIAVVASMWRRERGVPAAIGTSLAEVTVETTPPAAGPQDTAAGSAAAAAITRPKLSPAEWQRMLTSTQGIVDAFASAVQAAEAGDFGALREVHWLVTECAPIFSFARGGGKRDEFMQGQAQDLPPGGREQLEAKYERCAAIAHAPRFATWSEADGQLGHQYWERVGETVGDPMFTSFEVANFVDELSRARGADRELLESSIDEDVRAVLRSGDGTAWYDLGMRALSDKMGADPSYGLALILAACERGHDCTRANRHNLELNCGMNPDCSANSLEEAFTQRFPADVNARAHARLLELRLLIQQGDWAKIERFLPLDGTAFRPAAASSPGSSWRGTAARGKPRSSSVRGSA